MPRCGVRTVFVGPGGGVWLLHCSCSGKCLSVDRASLSAIRSFVRESSWLAAKAGFASGSGDAGAQKRAGRQKTQCMRQIHTGARMQRPAAFLLVHCRTCRRVACGYRRVYTTALRRQLLRDDQELGHEAVECGAVRTQKTQISAILQNATHDSRTEIAAADRPTA